MAGIISTVQSIWRNLATKHLPWFLWRMGAWNGEMSPEKWMISIKGPYFWNQDDSRWWFPIIFILCPRALGKMNPFWRTYFSKGLKPPTRCSYWGSISLFFRGVWCVDFNWCFHCMQCLAAELLPSTSHVDIEPQTFLGGGFKDFLCSPLFGEDSQFD